mgnify:CR=1 FL=1
MISIYLLVACLILLALAFVAGLIITIKDGTISGGGAILGIFMIFFLSFSAWIIIQEKIMVAN